MTAAGSTGPLDSAIETRLTELGALQAGWFDGQGRPISEDALSSARTACLELAGRGLHIRPYPRPDGGIVLEWSRRGVEWSLDVEPAGTWYAHGLNIDTDTVHEGTYTLLEGALQLIDQAA
jgi:hypothetical protein